MNTKTADNKVALLWIKSCLFVPIYMKYAANEFLDTKMNPRIIKTENSKSANSEGRLYQEQDINVVKVIRMLQDSSTKRWYLE